MELHGPHSRLTDVWLRDRSTTVQPGTEDLADIHLHQDIHLTPLADDHKAAWKLHVRFALCEARSTS